MYHRKKKMVITVVAIFVAIVIAVIAVFKAGDALKLLKRIDSDDKTANDYMNEMKTVYIDGKPYIEKSGLSSCLLIGLDRFGEAKSNESYNNSDLADFLLLLVFDSENQTYSMLHINRDTMTDIDILGLTGQKVDKVKAQIALSHTYGDGMKVSCQNTVRAVSNLLCGISVDHYVSVTMDAVSKMNDYIGGVDVTVTEDMTALDKRLVCGKTVSLDGDLALKFVRGRGGLEDSSNTTRMERQKRYINGVITSLKDCEKTSDFWTEAYDQVSPYMVTDFGINQVIDMLKKTDEYEYTGIISPEGKAVKGEKYMEFYVDENNLNSIITDLYYKPVE